MSDAKAGPCAQCGTTGKVITTFHVGRPWANFVFDSLGYAVTCPDCGMTTPSFMTEEHAIELWNRRADARPQ